MQKRVKTETKLDELRLEWKSKCTKWRSECRSENKKKIINFWQSTRFVWRNKRNSCIFNNNIDSNDAHWTIVKEVKWKVTRKRTNLSINLCAPKWMNTKTNGYLNESGPRGVGQFRRCHQMAGRRNTTACPQWLYERYEFVWWHRREFVVIVTVRGQRTVEFAMRWCHDENVSAKWNGHVFVRRLHQLRRQKWNQNAECVVAVAITFTPN